MILNCRIGGTLEGIAKAPHLRETRYFGPLWSPVTKGLLMREIGRLCDVLRSVSRVRATTTKKPVQPTT